MVKLFSAFGADRAGGAGLTFGLTAVLVCVVVLVGLSRVGVGTDTIVDAFTGLLRDGLQVLGLGS